jgi:hypothetical protein
VNNFPAHALPVLSDYARPQLVTTLISKSRTFSLTLLDSGDYTILSKATGQRCQQAKHQADCSGYLIRRVDRFPWY